MLAFLKRHWLLYLIGTALAIALGLSASYVVGVIGSTPDSVREEHVENEEQLEDELNDLSAETEGAAEGSSAAADGDTATVQ